MKYQPLSIRLEASLHKKLMTALKKKGMTLVGWIRIEADKFLKG